MCVAEVSVTQYTRVFAHESTYRLCDDTVCHRFELIFAEPVLSVERCVFLLNCVETLDCC